MLDILSEHRLLYNLINFTEYKQNRERKCCLKNKFQIAKSYNIEIFIYKKCNKLCNRIMRHTLLGVTWKHPIEEQDHLKISYSHVQHAHVYATCI